jgi:hypothetical protein
MKFMGVLLIVIGGVILGASVIAALLTAPQGEAMNFPILIGGVVLGSLFDFGGIVVMIIIPRM